jgi:hypothetical protein
LKSTKAKHQFPCHCYLVAGFNFSFANFFTLNLLFIGLGMIIVLVKVDTSPSQGAVVILMSVVANTCLA